MVLSVEPLMPITACGLGRNITWTSYNMPASITQGTTTISFQHDVDHQRIKQVAPSGTTLYINAFGVGAELFGAGTGAARWTDYLMVGSARVGMRVTNLAAQTVSTRYFHTDHLGSIAVITDENGHYTYYNLAAGGYIIGANAFADSFGNTGYSTSNSVRAQFDGTNPVDVGVIQVIITYDEDPQIPFVPANQ